MAKIKLGARPQHITRTITATMPDGTVGAIEARYRYRTRVEFGAFIDERVAAAKAKAAAEAEAFSQSVRAAVEAGQPAPEPAAFSVAGQQRESRDANAAYLLDILDGWNLDEPLSLDSARQLCDEAPGMAQALIDGYREAVVEGRLGN